MTKLVTWHQQQAAQGTSPFTHDSSAPVGELAVEPTRMWTRASALTFIANLQEPLMFGGWFLALAGGVLNKGYSDHDLDLVAVPMKTGNTDLEILHYVLSAAGLTRTHEATEMRQHWKDKGSPDGKYVEVYRTKDDKRVDVIVAYPEGR